MAISAPVSVPVSFPASVPVHSKAACYHDMQAEMQVAAVNVTNSSDAAAAADPHLAP
jgi:hypothetical protein